MTTTTARPDGSARICAERSIQELTELLLQEARVSQPPSKSAIPVQHTNTVVSALLRAALTGMLRHADFEPTPNREPSEVTSSARLLAAALARLELLDGETLPS